MGTACLVRVPRIGFCVLLTPHQGLGEHFAFWRRGEMHTELECEGEPTRARTEPEPEPEPVSPLASAAWRSYSRSRGLSRRSFSCKEEKKKTHHGFLGLS